MREKSCTSAPALCLRGMLYGELYNRQVPRLYFFIMLTVSGKGLNFLVVFHIVTTFITDTYII